MSISPVELSDEEQYVLELINRARANPSTEALRAGITLNEGINPGAIDPAAKQPLAVSAALTDAARAHSQVMIDENFFDHINPIDGSTPAERAQSAGYGSSFIGENIALRGTTAPLTLSLLRSYYSIAHEDLFTSVTGHRETMMNPSFREIGLGGIAGEFTNPENNVTFNSLALTEAFGAAQDVPFITGVAYQDANANSFYSLGEGVGGVEVTIDPDATVANNEIATTTASAGGYTLALEKNGSYTATFDGDALSTPISVRFSTAEHNVKIDLENGDTILTTTGVTLISGSPDVRHVGLYGGESVGDARANTLTGAEGDDVLAGLGGADTLWAADGDDTLMGGSDDDRLLGRGGDDHADGEAGDDRVLGGGGDDLLFGRQGEDKVRGGADQDTLFGGAGDDTLHGGRGSDRINGGEGDDILRGGRDADRFIFTPGDGNDEVIGFEMGSDRFELTGFSAQLSFDDLELRSVNTHTLLVLSEDQQILIRNVSPEDVLEHAFIFL